MATSVLVSGSFHAGWCWERVTPLLADAGHRAVAPDLLGLGDDPTPLAKVSLDDWTAQIADLVATQREQVVIVGHSRGGLVVSEVAAGVPRAIGRLVYLAAMLIRPGQTMLDTLAPLDNRARAVPASPAARDGTIAALADLVDRLYSLTAPEWAARARAMIGREQPSVFVTPLALTAERYGSVPRAYVECVNDRALPIA